MITLFDRMLPGILALVIRVGGGAFSSLNGGTDHFDSATQTLDDNNLDLEFNSTQTSEPTTILAFSVAVLGLGGCIRRRSLIALE